MYRARHAAMCECGEASPDIELTFETTIAEWRLELGLVSCSRLGAAIADWFGFDYVAADWKRLLYPEKHRKLRGVCRYVAARATVPVFEAAQVLAASDKKAGIFITLRELLKSHGADVTDLRPSSPLVDFASRGFPEIHSLLVRCSPCAFELIRATYRSEFLLMLGAIVLLMGCVTFGVLGFNANSRFLLLALVSLGLYVLLWRLSERLQRRPIRVDFQAITTFRQLCEALASPPSPKTPPRCPRCAYPLVGLESRRCPECGRPFFADEFGLTEGELAALLTTNAADPGRRQPD